MRDDTVNVNNILIYLILFADDTVLFGKSPELLQELLDKLLKYCHKWNIEVNTEKTKVIVFRNGWQPVSARFFYDNKELEIVNSCIYLGMMFYFNGKFVQTQKRVSQQGSRALSSLLNSVKDLYLSKKKQLDLFDSMVASVLNYASEIWGFNRGKDVEIIHNRFCRYILKVGKSVPNLFFIWRIGPFSYVYYEKI